MFDVDENSPPADCLEKWHIKVLPGGTYVLIFVTTEKWIRFFPRNENVFEFGDRGEEQWQYIPDFLPEIRGRFFRTWVQDKDHIYVVYTPKIAFLKAVNVRYWSRNERT